MDYQVWTKDEYDNWQRVECGDYAAVQRELEKAIRTGKEPLVTIEVPYDINIKLKEALIGEVKKSKSKPDKVAELESESEVRSGDTESVQKLDK